MWGENPGGIRIRKCMPLDLDSHYLLKNGIWNIYTPPQGQGFFISLFSHPDSCRIKKL